VFADHLRGPAGCPCRNEPLDLRALAAVLDHEDGRLPGRETFSRMLPTTPRQFAVPTAAAGSGP
jgi:hypothetical protein